MKTLFALLIMFVACTMGLIAVAIVMVIMGFAGAPGAMLFAVGQKRKSALLGVFGLILAALGQSYVAGAYAVFVVGLLRWFSTGRPDVPTWPLWIAAFIHSGAAPTYGMKERPEQPTAQHRTLGIVSLAATVVFLIAAFAPPGSLRLIYGWVPLFEEKEGKGVYLTLELDNARDVNQYTVFNTNIHTLQLCNATAGENVADVLATAPDDVPKDSKIKSWRCSLIPPGKSR
jgi:hypothetical protein